VIEVTQKKKANGGTEFLAKKKEDPAPVVTRKKKPA
jgi:hypothetical protein